MNLEHNLSRLFAAEREEFLQNQYNEIHGSVIVVQEYHFVHGRRLNFALLSLEQNTVAISTSHWHFANATPDRGLL